MQKREIFTEDCVLGKKRKALKLFSTSLLGKKKKRLNYFQLLLSVWLKSVGVALHTGYHIAQARSSQSAEHSTRGTPSERLASLFQILTETAWGGAQALQGKDSMFLKTVPTMQSIPQASLQRPLS